jgi:pentatricopeptide repeat protein
VLLSTTPLLSIVSFLLLLLQLLIESLLRVQHSTPSQTSSSLLDIAVTFFSDSVAMASIPRAIKHTKRTVTAVGAVPSDLQRLQRTMKRVRNFAMAGRVMEEAEDLGFGSDLYLWTGYLSASIGEGWRTVLSVWHRMQTHLAGRLDSWAYTEFLKACSDHGQYTEAVNTIREMDRYGILVDQIAYNALILCAAKTRQPLRDLHAILDDMAADGIDITRKDTRFSVMNYYAEMGLGEEIEGLLLDCLSQPYASNFDDFNEMIGVSLKCLLRMSPIPVQLAEKWFRTWLHFTDVQSAVPWTIMMHIYVCTRQYTKALQYYDEMCADGCEPNIVTYGELMNIYSKLGWLQDADDLLCEMEVRGIAANSYIADAYDRLQKSLKENNNNAVSEADNNNIKRYD